MLARLSRVARLQRAPDKPPNPSAAGRPRLSASAQRWIPRHPTLCSRNEAGPRLLLQARGARTRPVLALRGWPRQKCWLGAALDSPSSQPSAHSCAANLPRLRLGRHTHTSLVSFLAVRGWPRNCVASAHRWKPPEPLVALGCPRLRLGGDECPNFGSGPLGCCLNSRACGSGQQRSDK